MPGIDLTALGYAPVGAASKAGVCETLSREGSARPSSLIFTTAGGLGSGRFGESRAVLVVLRDHGVDAVGTSGVYDLT